MITALCALLVSASLTGGFQEMLSDSFDIPVGDYRYVLFGLNEPQQDSARVEGSMEVAPDTLQLEILLFHIDDFNRWVSDQGEVDTLYYARAASGPLTIPVPGFGDFVLVLSNRGNWQPASVSAAFTLAYAGSGVAYNPLVDASKLVLGMLAAAVLLAVVIGAVVTIRRHRTRLARRAAGKVDSTNLPT
jgi:hypothetical protein